MNENRLTTNNSRISSNKARHLLKGFVPNGGTLLIVAVLLMTQSLWARPIQSTNSAIGPSATTVNYQGRLADSAGVPLDGTYGMSLALYDAATGGNPVWTEDHPAVPVSDGLFSVGLGSRTAGGIPTTTWNGDRYLEITVGGETLSPRELIRSVPIAGMALTVPDGAIGTNQIADGAIGAEQIADGSITSGKLNLDGAVDLHGNSLIGVNAVEKDGNILHPAAGTTPSIRLISQNSVFVFIDSDNTQTNQTFSVYANNSSIVSPYIRLMTVDENGDLWVRGSVTQGAVVEANLQTSEEAGAERIERFSEGDVLCWDVDRLELCSEIGNTLVQAIADKNGKPIVLGAELVKVLGPVQPGDLLIASDTPGYATVNNNPRPGAVIAQALEAFDGERGVIKAMIRKF